MDRKELFKYTIDIITITILLVMSLYHLGLFIERKNDLSTLYFGLVCISVTLRTISVDEKLLIDLFPSLPFIFVHKLEFFSIYSSMILFLSLINTLFPLEINNKIYQILKFTGIIGSLIVLIFPMNIYGELNGLMYAFLLLTLTKVIYTTTKAFFKKREGAFLYLFAFLTFAFSVIVDLMSNQNYFSIPNISSYGLIVFIFMQSIVLAKRFSKAFKIAETQRDQLDLANKEIDSLNKTKDEFLANLSHELKTPLSIVFAYSQMLELHKDNPKKIEKFSTHIHSNAAKLNEYISDLILVTDIESKVVLQKSLTNLKTLILEAKDSLDQLIVERSIQFKLDIRDDISLRIDHILIKKAILAVLKNAILYNKPSGKVEIKLFDIEQFYEIHIIDSGIGIPEVFQEKIFEKFYRIDTSINYEVSGVGIGLFLAKKILELHKGSIHFINRPDEGSTFVLSLPRNSL